VGILVDVDVVVEIDEAEVDGLVEGEPDEYAETEADDDDRKSTV
jgi:hypothetical protein